jgi:hypothetical protein
LMSGFGGKPDEICSHGVLRILTQGRRGRRSMLQEGKLHRHELLAIAIIRP